MKPGASHKPALRRRALMLMRSGRWTLGEVALIVHVGRSTAWRWMRDAGLDVQRDRHAAIARERELTLAIIENRAPPLPHQSRRHLRAVIAAGIKKLEKPC